MMYGFLKFLLSRCKAWISTNSSDVLKYTIGYWLQMQIRSWLNARKYTIYFDRTNSQLSTIISTCTALTQPYNPPFLFHCQFSQLFLLLLRGWLYKYLYSIQYREQLVSHPDCGLTSIDWFDSDHSDSVTLPDDAPVVIFLHTLTGNSESTAPFVRYARRRGWRACVFNRRGHAHALQTATFNIMGCAADTERMTTLVSQQYPNAFLAMVGISAGSGQIISYLGKAGVSTPIRAAASLCPAYDISAAFHEFDESYPWLSAHLTDSVRELFLQTNRELLMAHHGPESYARLEQTQKLGEFIREHVGMAGYNSHEEYLTYSNPMVVFHQNRTPTLVLNALDDPVCLASNIPMALLQHACSEQPYVIVLSQSGSHIAFAEGWFGMSSWMERVTMDWLEACRQQMITIRHTN